MCVRSPPPIITVVGVKICRYSLVLNYTAIFMFVINMFRMFNTRVQIAEFISEFFGGGNENSNLIV